MDNKFYSQVSEFNKEVIGYNQPEDIEKLPTDVKELTLIQLREEIQELSEASTKTEEIDALTDLVYFAYGSLYKMGVHEELFTVISTIVHDANMTKAAGKKAERGYEGSAQDAVKPEDFVPPENTIAVLIDDQEFLDAN